MKVTNVSGYRFVDLDDHRELKDPHLSFCNKLKLKGTILLSPNGINFSLAGHVAPGREIKHFLMVLFNVC